MDEANARSSAGPGCPAYLWFIRPWRECYELNDDFHPSSSIAHSSMDLLAVRGGALGPEHLGEPAQGERAGAGLAGVLVEYLAHDPVEHLFRGRCMVNGIPSGWDPWTSTDRGDTSMISKHERTLMSAGRQAPAMAWAGKAACAAWSMRAKDWARRGQSVLRRPFCGCRSEVGGCARFCETGMGWDDEREGHRPSSIEKCTYARGRGAAGVQDHADEAQGREAAGGLGGLALGAGAL